MKESGNVIVAFHSYSVLVWRGRPATLKRSKVRFSVKNSRRKKSFHFETTISGSPLATGIHCLFSSLRSKDIFSFEFNIDALMPVD